jgi:BNR repeat-like domain/BNR/Asp-box repeat
MSRPSHRVVCIGLVLPVILSWIGTGQAAEAPSDQPLADAVIYDHDPATKLGDDVFGDVICNMEKDAPGRCSHGGPICMEYPDGSIVAFHTNASDHNLDGWSEFAVSKDGGKTWQKYNKFAYSHKAYQEDPKRPAWVEEGLVTNNGTVVLFVSHFDEGKRVRSVVMRSHDNGSTWSAPDPLDGDFVGYPTSVAVSGKTNYVLFDSNAGPHVLYVSTDDGKTWQKRSTLTLQSDAWYGAMCIMEDGRLLAGAYVTADEDHLYYCISKDEGRTWSEQRLAHVDKKVRDPELACLAGKYYLHGRSGHSGEGAHRFVLYQSDDGIHWKSGLIVSGDREGPDGYSHNCILHQHDPETPDELMIEYSIQYAGRDTNEYVFFVRPEME